MRMNLKNKKFKILRYVISFFLVFSYLVLPQMNVKAVSLWQSDSGSLNYNTNYNGMSQAITTANGNIYEAWYESSSSVNQIRVKQFNGALWSFIDGGGSTGINFNTAYSAIYPSVCTLNNNLYVTWTENCSTGFSQIRVKMYNTTTNVWSCIDGGSATVGLNYVTTASASNPQIAAYNGNIYVTWIDNGGQVRVKVYNTTTNTWSFIDGMTSGINYNVTKMCLYPQLYVYNGTLCVTWEEPNASGVYQIRVKQYNGTSWSMIDGAGANGINFNTADSAFNPNMVSYNGNLYVTWVETNGSCYQTRVKQYNGTTWSFIDGGATTGLNYNTGQYAESPSIAVYQGNIYTAWYERNATSMVWQLRVKTYNTSNSTWSWADGGGAYGLNYNTAYGATTPYGQCMIVYNNSLFTTWYELNSSNFSQIRYKSFENGLDAITATGGGFSESTNNDGSVPGVMDFNLSTQAYNGTIGEDFIADGKATLYNYPSGLIPHLIMKSSTQIELSFSGNAYGNSVADNVANIVLQLGNTAFTCGNAQIIDDSTIPNLTMTFIDNPEIAYSTSILNEDVANTGTVSSTVNLTLTGNTFLGTNNTDLTKLGYVSVTNVPPGLTASVIKNSATTATLSFAGKAINHTQGASTNNTAVTFNPIAFGTQTSTALNVSNIVRPISIIFAPCPSISYSTNTITESTSNDGTVNATITATLTGDTFAGTAGLNYITAGAVTINNLPPGLTASVVRGANNNQAVITITGVATNHSPTNDINNLEVKFADIAFNATPSVQVVGYDSMFNVNYYGGASISYSGTAFTGSNSNDGSIANSINVLLSGDTFTGNLGDDLVANGKMTISGLPTGLTASAIEVTPTTLCLSLNGKALNFATLGTVNINTALTNSAVTSGNISTEIGSTDTIPINFQTNASNCNISYSTTSLNEDPANDGTVSSNVTMTLTGNTFLGATGSDLTQLGYVTVTNVPAGLTAVVTKTSSATAVLSFTGKAINHTVADSVSNIGITFNNAAFGNQSTSALNITNLSNKISINYAPAPKITYNTNTIVESQSNDGTVNATITGTLVGDTFAGTSGTDYTKIGAVTINNLPTGLNADVIMGSSNNQVIITVTGKAVNHLTSNDISNLEFKFGNTAFNSTPATQVVNYDSMFNVDYLSGTVINYSATSFTASTNNDGSIENTIDLTLTGDTFTGKTGDDFISNGKMTAIGVPQGLVASAVEISPTDLRLSLTGQATNHQSANNTSINIALTDQAFTNGKAILDTGSTNIIPIKFQDSSSLVYSTTSFNANSDGSVTSSSAITLASTSGVSFSGNNGDDLVSLKKAYVNNVPSGLTPVISRLNDSTVSLGFTGKALAHQSVNSVNNISVTFSQSAFNGNSAGMISGTVNNIGINFMDSLALNYNSGVFKESVANDGSIENSLTVTIGGGNSFANSPGYNYVANGDAIVTNLPAGLTCSIINNSTSSASITLSGNAVANDITNNVYNLGIEFKDSAFTGGNASNIVNSKRNDLCIAFRSNGTPSDNKVALGSTNGFAQKTVSIPVTFTNNANAVAYSFKVSFDPTVFQFESVTDGITQNTVNNTTASSGVVTVGSVDTDGTLIPSGQVFTANFKILKATTGSAISVVNTDVVDIDMNGTATDVQNSNVGIRQYGDILNRGNVDMSDVVKAVRCSLGIDTVTGADLTAGDVTGAGKIDNLDVLYILKRALGMPITFPVEQ